MDDLPHRKNRMPSIPLLLNAWLLARAALFRKKRRIVQKEFYLQSLQTSGTLAVGPPLQVVTCTYLYAALSGQMMLETQK